MQVIFRGVVFVVETTDNGYYVHEDGGYPFTGLLFGGVKSELEGFIADRFAELTSPHWS